MKISIISLVSNRPDLIELQYKSIKKYVKNIDFEYIVYNNNIENSEIYYNVFNICKTYGIIHKNVNISKYYGNGGIACYSALNWIIKQDSNNLGDIICYIDADMFFIKEVFIENILDNNDMAIIPQYKQELDSFYMWNCFFILNRKTLRTLNELNFSYGNINGVGVDVGGYTYYFFKKYKSMLKIKYIECWMYIDGFENNDYIYLDTSLNGNMHYEIKVTKMLNILEFKSKDFKFCQNKCFEYEDNFKNLEEYSKYYTRKYIQVKDWIKCNKLDNSFKPIFIDLINKKGDVIDSSFILHYKSSSNYSYFQTFEYNKLKTEKIKQLIG
jgi:hypothetical protein